MITIDNYFNEITKFDRSTFQDALNKGHEFVLKATNNGSSWTAYHSSEGIEKTIDLYLQKLNEFVKKSEKKTSSKQTKNEKSFFREVDILKPLPSEKSKQNDKKEKAVKTTPAKASPVKPDFQVTMVERIPEELRFIKRFVQLDGKTKTKDEILRFINSLQKAIIEKRIRKTSTWADQIKEIQNKLIEVYNSMKQKLKFELKSETVERLKNLASGEAVMPSINFIKRYISLNGKSGIKEKVKQLLKQINRAFDKEKISDGDLYIAEINDIRKNLEEFFASKGDKTLQIEKATLNGLEGILGCACQQHNGLDELPPVMNSMAFAKLKFETLGFTGKWLNFMGDPSPGFRAMVFGKPKFGKSTLCAEFAGYLARVHGKVLYVAKEERLNRTLQDKLNNVKHPNLDVASLLPNDLNVYNFVFLDSVTKLGLSPDDLSRLNATYPAISFIEVYQVTKSGRFRGGNSFQHDVDIVIEVPEWGKAVQMGRFNQGGEMDIFSEQVLSLDGKDDWKKINTKIKTRSKEERYSDGLKRIKKLLKKGLLVEAYEELQHFPLHMKYEIPDELYREMLAAWNSDKPNKESGG